MEVQDGEDNVWIGEDLFLNATTAKYNTAIGAKSLTKVTSGTRNVAVGTESMLDFKSGHYNTCVGWESGKKGVSVQSNCNFGGRASMYNTSGHFGCNYGYQAGANATSNYGGCAFGMQALYYASGGYYNIGVGYQAGNQNLSSTSGNGYSNCIFIGNYSGVPKAYSSTYGLGDHNIFIGHKAQGKDTDPFTSYENQIVIGKEAKGAGSNTVVLGNEVCSSWQSTERSASGTSPCDLGSSNNPFGQVFCHHITALLPNSINGLSVGQMWNDNGTVKIVIAPP